MLHDRTEIHYVMDQLDKEEKYLLFLYDFMLLNNLENVFKQIEKVHDFSSADKNNIPTSQWWWHLDKLANGKLNINVSTEKIF